MKYCIIAVGYNRPDSLKRLVSSLLSAEYGSYSVDLIISIDKSTNQDDVVNSILGIEWVHGGIKIVKQTNRLGLRKHIISCGDYTERYDAIIMFEDDIVVSPYFFNYVTATVSKYGNDSRIAGISLYKHETHPGVYRPFYPDNNGYDVFFMQFAQSWGQCWTKEMWRNFKVWYSHNENADLGRDDLLPSYISSWNAQSWLKYYMRYIVETNRYFVYPYVSLSTNASDEGEHNVNSNNDFQVGLLSGSIEYRLPSFNEAIKYDVYFERQEIEDCVFSDLNGTKLMDLYGQRKAFLDADYLISTQSLPFRVVYSIQIKYRPHEVNCFIPEKGSDAFVYDLKKTGDKPIIKQQRQIRYDVRAISWKRLIKLGTSEFLSILRSKIRRKRKK